MEKTYLNNFKKGCAYIRVSTDRQEELSPDAQKRLIYDYAKNNQIELNEEDIYVEIGISGKSADKRPEFQRMIATSKEKNHPYDVILVWKFSRFARNQEESIVYKALLKKNNVDVISISEPLVEGPFGSLIERIIEWMDEYYSIRLSGEVKRGMQEKVLKHGYVHTAPFGYNHKRGEIPSINEKESEVVKIIYNQYVNERKSLHDIAQWLNERCYYTKRGTKFDNRRVLYILQNPFYIGKIRLNDNVYDGVHEHIVSDDLFNAAAERYRTEYIPRKRRPASSCMHWLSGVIMCSSCGGSLGFNRCIDKKGNSYPNFYCWKSGKGICYAKTGIPVWKAEQYVIDGLQQLLASDHIEYDIIRTENTDMEYNALYERLDIIKKRESRARKAYLDGIDTIEDYKETKSLLDKERQEIKKQLNKMDSLQHTINDEAMYGAVQNVIDIITDENTENEKKAAAIRSICKNIEYNKSTDEMTFHLYFSV